MEITLAQGIALSLLALVAGMDFYVEAFFWFRPIIVGTVTGLILGDLETAVVCAGLTELAFAGLTPAGGTPPPNPILAGIMAPVLAYTTGVSPAEALALSLPFSFLMQYVILMFWSGYSLFMPKLDAYAKEADTKRFYRLNIMAWITVGLSYALVVFLSAYLAQDAMKALVEAMPAWLIHGFEIIGGVLPAIGFAMLLKIMLKGWLVPYLIFGFIFASLIPFTNLLPLAALGLGLAIMEYYRLTEKKTVAFSGEGSDGDGI